jgi:hypothetical protein
VVAKATNFFRKAKTGNGNTQISICEPMPIHKYAFGICAINQFIYVIGGIKITDRQRPDAQRDECERFDVLRGPWSGIESLPDFYTINITAI